MKNGILFVLAWLLSWVAFAQLTPMIGIIAKPKGEPYYGLTGATYDNKSFDTNTQLSGATMMSLSVDGTHLLVGGTGDVWSYTIDPQDISTASYVANYTALPGTMQQHSWADNGNKIFALSQSEFSFTYTLSTAYDVTTITNGTSGGAWTTQGTDIRDVVWSDDGTMAWFLDGTIDRVSEWSLSPAFTNTGYTDNATTLSLSAASPTAPRDMCFSPDGKTLIVVEYTGALLYEYTLTTPWDISTATYTQNFSISGQMTNGYTVTYNSDGSKLFVGSLTRVIYQYDIAN